MRTTNMEIEFKTSISENKYNELLDKFDLRDNIFKQTNYYFDTVNLDLSKSKTVLRIRQKGERFKVTLKKQSEVGAFENHVFLTKDEALDLIENGFNTKKYFDEIDFDVKFYSSLDNYRVSTPYLEGTLFLDKCVYRDVVDYEVEYEYFDLHEGEKIFKDFLNEHEIEYLKTKRKSEKALNLSK